MEKTGSEKKGIKLRMLAVLLMLALIPLICGIVALSVAAYSKMSNEITVLMEQKLQSAATFTQEYFSCDWTEWNEESLGYSLAGTDAEWQTPPTFLDSDISYIDSSANIGDASIQLTVFKGNKRFLSSIRNDAGERVYGTEAKQEIADAILSGKKDEWTENGVIINGDEYLVTYLPMYNGDGNGEIVGMAFAGLKSATLSKVKKQLLNTIILISIIIMSICSVGVVFLARTITKPLKVVAKGTERMAGGDLDVTFEAKSLILETSQIIGAARSLQGNLQNIVRNIRSTATDLSGAVSETGAILATSADGTEQINRASAELAQGATTMAQSVQDLNTNMVEIGNNIESIDAAVKALTELSDDMSVISNEAHGDITAVYDSSEKSVQAAGDITDQMGELAEAIKSVNEATNLISGIANQTKLLSLNASIEAARAGEQGKGFAVVAESIGNLATESNDGVMQITEICNKILSLSEVSMKLIEDIKSLISDEQEKVQKTQECFEKLKEEIDASIQQISNISTETKTLAEAKDAVISSAADLSAISEENAASTQQTAANVENLRMNISAISEKADSMNEMSKELEEAIGAFKE